MKHEEIKVGEYYRIKDIWGIREDMVLVFVVGRDPFTGKFIVTCKDWEMGMDFLEDEEIETMERI